VVSAGPDGTCEWQSGSVNRYPDRISTVCSAGTTTFSLFHHITVSNFYTRFLTPKYNAVSEKEFNIFLMREWIFGYFF